MEKATTAERLRQIMQERNLKQVDILELCKPYCKKYNEKLGKSILSQYLSGSVIPGQSKLTILGLALNVNEVWLMGYDVQKERTDSHVPIQADVPLTLDEKRMLDYFRNFNDEGREEALKRLSEMSELDRYKKRADFEEERKEA